MNTQASRSVTNTHTRLSTIANSLYSMGFEEECKQTHTINNKVNAFVYVSRIHW